MTLDNQSRLCLHRIVWPWKPTPTIKQRVSSYHTTEVIAHQKPKSGCHGNVPKVQGIGNMCTLSADHSETPLHNQLPNRYNSHKAS